MSGDNAEDREIARRMMSKAEREQLEQDIRGLTEPNPNAPKTQYTGHCAELMIFLRNIEARLAAVEAERDRLRAALEKLADKRNYKVNRDEEIEWDVVTDPELNPWDFAWRYLHPEAGSE